jgi:hypothetical protein
VLQYLGRYTHRSAISNAGLMQIVREIVDEIGGTRVNTHRLMDYNNHPDTTLADIHSMLRRAQTRLEQRLR